MFPAYWRILTLVLAVIGMMFAAAPYAAVAAGAATQPESVGQEGPQGAAGPERSRISRANVLVGAIRWDAWQDDGRVNAEVERTLGPAKWHYRVPFFGKIVGENQVSIRGNSQEVMDREIGYAKEAGLDYWAFVSYAADSGMSNGLKRYLASERKKDIKFCLIGGGNILSATHRQKMVRQMVGCFADESYVKVLGGRPLVCIFTAEKAVGEGKTFATWSEARKGLEDLRKESIAKGTGNPYVVIQGWNVKNDKQKMEWLGADAIGAYGVGSPKEVDRPYSALREAVKAKWQLQKESGAPMVPIVSTGWDRRPRAEAGGVFWEEGPGNANSYAPPRAEELAEHVREAIEWTAANPAAAAAKAMLIYAWNENDEGGWLVPTIRGDGTVDESRVEALRSVLRKQAPK